MSLTYWNVYWNSYWRKEYDKLRNVFIAEYEKIKVRANKLQQEKERLIYRIKWLQNNERDLLKQISDLRDRLQLNEDDSSEVLIVE